MEYNEDIKEKKKEVTNVVEEKEITVKESATAQSKSDTTKSVKSVSTYNVSRNAVYKQIQITIDKLKELEEKLHLFSKKQKLEKMINEENIASLKEQLKQLIEE